MSFHMDATASSRRCEMFHADSREDVDFMFAFSLGQLGFETPQDVTSVLPARVSTGHSLTCSYSTLQRAG